MSTNAQIIREAAKWGKVNLFIRKIAETIFNVINTRLENIVADRMQNQLFWRELIFLNCISTTCCEKYTEMTKVI